MINALIEKKLLILVLNKEKKTRKQERKLTESLHNLTVKNNSKKVEL